MAIKTLPDPTIVYGLANEEDWADAYITVFGAATLFVGPNKEQLEMAEGGAQQGIQLTANNTSGAASPPRIHFIGALYGRSSLAKTQVDVTVFAKRPGVLKVERRHRG